ncbi:MAG: NAD-binding protein [Chloroflexi bacterium]|nr:NAD-binding protein [Chloroflexota bacterium]
MNVVIIGVGDIGKDVATTLASRKETRLVLVDSSEERCKELADQLDALVLKGDGSDPAILAEAKVADADAVIATTGSDSLNTVIAMLAKQAGAQKVMVKLNEAYLSAACYEIGVSRVVTPKVSAAAEFTAAIFGFSRIDASLLVRGNAMVAEVPTGSSAGKSVGEIEMPGGSRLIALLREEQAIVPSESTHIEGGDTLLVLAEDSKAIESVYRALDL